MSLDELQPPLLSSSHNSNYNIRPIRSTSSASTSKWSNDYVSLAVTYNNWLGRKSSKKEKARTKEAQRGRKSSKKEQQRSNTNIHLFFVS